MAALAQHRVLIAGGGPVGLVTALALARQGVEVLVFEAAEAIDASPRAATTHPATLEILAELGLLDEVIRRGLVARTLQFWDRPSGRLIAEFDHRALEGDTRYPFVVQCEQHKLAGLAIEKLSRFAHAQVRFSARVASIEVRADGVKVEIATGKGTETTSGGYLVGADGGRSTVRKALGIAFEGYTIPERFLVLTTPFDFAAQLGCCLRNYFSDPDEWANLFKVAGSDGSGLWRAVFPVRPGETEAQILGEEAVQRRLQGLFSTPHPYPVVHRNLYDVHQRVAATFRGGRAFLVGDAAHINNPIGGLGLNCGIADAVELADLLGRVLRKGEAPDLLGLYDQRRRAINIEYVQRQTIANKRRLEERDARARAAGLELLRTTAADAAAHRAFLLRASLLETRPRPTPP